MLKNMKFSYHAAMGVVFSILVVGCNSSNSAAVTDSPATSVKKTLKRMQNISELEKNLKQLMRQSYGKITPIFYTFEGDAPTAGLEASSDSSNSSSSTNTQVVGVDEADRIKNDDAYLYIASASQGSIKAYSTLTGNAIVQDEITLRPDANISGLYLFNDKLIALSNNNSYAHYTDWFDINQWNKQSTQLDLLHTNNGKMDKENNLQIDGQLISSRRIEDTLYLVTRHTPTLDGLVLYPNNDADVEKNLALIDAATLSDLLPDYSVNGDNKGDVLAASHCFSVDYPNNSYQQATIINVLSIDLNNATAQPKGSCFVGNTEALYVSTNSLYLATTQYDYQVNNGIAFYQPEVTTDIHKFSLDGLNINYKGSAEVSGHLGWQQDLKSFRMGEFTVTDPNNADADPQQIFGVITYTGNQLNTNASPAKLTTLEEDSSNPNRLKILAQLPNNKHPESLGKPGEQIYATRFIGDKAYLVTFRTTDPLYIVDMSDPADPFIAGELKVDGYSDYLHPIGDKYLLGIGKDAVPAINAMGDSRGAWYQGVKLSLIDISNPQTPREVWQEIIGKRGTETTVSNTHHGITFLAQGDNIKIALPISLHDKEVEGGPIGINELPTDEFPTDTITIDAAQRDNTKEITPNRYYKWQYDALYQYSINTQTGVLTPLEIIKSPTSREDKFAMTIQYDRSAFIGGRAYYLHGDKIISGN